MPASISLRGAVPRCASARVGIQARQWIWIVFVSVLTLLCSGRAFGSDCLQAKSTATGGAPMRAAPKASAAELARLRGSASTPLIAIIPLWYETRTTTGASAFVSKQSTSIVPCAASQASEAPFELHAIDVGTGLALLVRGVDFTLLFDAGTNDDPARGDDNRVVAYLQTLSPDITRINHLLLSHPHKDHVELMADVLETMDVEHVWNSGAYNNICGYRAFLKAVAQETGVQYHTASHGAGNEAVLLPKKKCYGVSDEEQTIAVAHADRISDAPISLGEGATMHILHADGSKRSSFNENSLVVRLDLGARRILIMGDAEAGGRKSPAVLPSPNSIEGKLLACCIDQLKADVLVAGHHGSKTSSRTAFLDAVGAKVFVVSAGPTRYASVTLPDAEVITELENRGEVFRTDLDDDQCAASEDKIGADNDGKPGGCSNIVVTLPADGPVTAEYQQASD